MVQATDRFLKEIRKSHQVVSYVDVRSPSQEIRRLPAIEGDVKVDRTAAFRRSCTVQCVDPLGDLVPRGVDSLLTPYGTEILPYRGVRYTDGTEELYPLGVFRLSKVNVVDGASGSSDIGIEAFDSSRRISRHKFNVPYVIEQGTSIVDAIKLIVERTIPNVEYDAVSTSLLTSAPKVYDAGSDPWEAVTALAKSIGCDVYFDTIGRLTLAPPYDIDALPAPSFTYIEGLGCTMIDLSLILSDEPGYNGVIVVGESVGDELPPVRGEAWDEEPSSATYRHGPYGEVPLFVQDTNVKTEDEAEAAAQGLLNGYLGFSSQLSINASVNPALEGGDVVQVQRERSGVSGLYVADAFNVPFRGSATQAITLRQKRTVG